MTTYRNNSWLRFQQWRKESNLENVNPILVSHFYQAKAERLQDDFGLDVWRIHCKFLGDEALNGSIYIQDVDSNGLPNGKTENVIVWSEFDHDGTTATSETCKPVWTNIAGAIIRCRQALEAAQKEASLGNPQYNVIRYSKLLCDEKQQSKENGPLWYREWIVAFEGYCERDDDYSKPDELGYEHKKIDLAVCDDFYESLDMPNGWELFDLSCGDGAIDPHSETGFIEVQLWLQPSV